MAGLKDLSWTTPRISRPEFWRELLLQILAFLDVIFCLASPCYLLACNILSVWLFPLTYCVFVCILLHNLAVVLEVVSLAFYCVGSLVCCLPFTFGVSTNPMDTISQKLGRNLTGLNSLSKNKAFRYRVIA